MFVQSLAAATEFQKLGLIFGLVIGLKIGLVRILFILFGLCALFIWTIKVDFIVFWGAFIIIIFQNTQSVYFYFKY